MSGLATMFGSPTTRRWSHMHEQRFVRFAFHRGHGHPLSWALTGLLAVGTGGCVAGETPEYRGRDRGAWFVSARARVDLSRSEPAPERRFRFEPGVELDTRYVQGDFQQEAQRPDYSVFCGALTFAPRLEAFDVRVQPMVGFGYLDIGIEQGSAGFRQDGLGVHYGVEVAYHLDDLVTPFFRATDTGVYQASCERFEAGVQASLSPNVGLWLGYAAQTAEVAKVGLFATRGDARIKTEGVSFGMSFDF